MTDTAPMPTPTDNLPRMIPVAKVAARMGISRQTLRAAAAEALLAGGLLLADVQRSTSSANYGQIQPREERFLKAMEMLREALS